MYNLKTKKTWSSNGISRKAIHKRTMYVIPLIELDKNKPKQIHKYTFMTWYTTLQTNTMHHSNKKIKIKHQNKTEKKKELFHCCKNKTKKQKIPAYTCIQTSQLNILAKPRSKPTNKQTNTNKMCCIPKWSLVTSKPRFPKS